MGKTHQNQKKPAQPKSKTNALATGKINTINRKKTPSTQNSTQTHLGLCYSAMGNRLKFQPRNPRWLAIQDSPIFSQ
jgi:hypothetical protein